MKSFDNIVTTNAIKLFEFKEKKWEITLYMRIPFTATNAITLQSAKDRRLKMFYSIKEIMCVLW